MGIISSSENHKQTGKIKGTSPFTSQYLCCLFVGKVPFSPFFPFFCFLIRIATPTNGKCLIFSILGALLFCASVVNMRKLMLFFFINMISFFSVSSAETMRMQLIHRHSAEMAGNPKTQLQRLRELLHRDITRHSQKLTARRMAWERNVSSEMAMRSGADDGTAEYFVAIKVGTPAQKFLLIADTGSDLTWMNCNRERRRLAQQSTRRRRRRRRRVFHADRSSSFKSVPCSSDMCKIGLMNMFSLTQCPTPISPCAYVYR